MNELYFFYGRECPHCERMMPIIDALEKNTGVNVERLEVWYDKENMHKLAGLDKDLCGGVPFFYNMETKKWICGEATLEELKTWAGK